MTKKIPFSLSQENGILNTLYAVFLRECFPDVGKTLNRKAKDAVHIRDDYSE
jgi:hypothetical protein